jgi:hypothetical protein
MSLRKLTMTNLEFIDFMQELVIAPDSIIKKAHMETATQN